MDRRPDNIREELLTVSPVLAEMARVNVFVTPPYYFEQLPASILQLVASGALQVSPALTKKNPFNVPQGYFESLPTAILQKVVAEQNERLSVSEELETIAPFLNTINKQMVYAVPAGYFAALQYDAKPNAFHKKKKPVAVVRSIYRYAVAAVLTGLLAIGAYFFTRDHSSYDGSLDTASSIEKELKKISDKEIASYLDSNNFAVEVNTTNIYLNDDLPIHEYIKNLSEEEIRAYLKENSLTKKEI